MNFDLPLFKRHLQEADIVLSEHEIKGSLTYLPFGWKLRDRLYTLATELLQLEGFSEIHLTDIALKSEVAKLDVISPVSKNYFSIEDTNYVMAAGHEVPFYLFLKRYLRHGPPAAFPLRFFHFGSVFRSPKNTKFPFSLGERRSFLECYIAYQNSEDGEKHLNAAANWNRQLIREVLHLPSVEVERPLITNKPFSRKTVCIDSITPLGVTVITGMSYLHDDIFTRILEVKYKDPTINKNKLAHTVHFGVSDHLFFSYLLSSHDERGFRLLNKLAPYQVALIAIEDGDSRYSEEIERIKAYLQALGFSCSITKVTPKKLARQLEEQTRKGIPLLITLSNRTGLSLFSRGNPTPRALSLGQLEHIKESLEQNDREIIERFSQIQAEQVVHCDSVSEINHHISQGKLARIYLQNTASQIRALESQLHGGEILGFAQSERAGTDALTSAPVSSWAYISRRT